MYPKGNSGDLGMAPTFTIRVKTYHTSKCIGTSGTRKPKNRRLSSGDNASKFYVK